MRRSGLITTLATLVLVGTAGCVTSRPMYVYSDGPSVEEMTRKRERNEQKVERFFMDLLFGTFAGGLWGDGTDKQMLGAAITRDSLRYADRQEERQGLDIYVHNENSNPQNSTPNEIRNQPKSNNVFGMCRSYERNDKGSWVLTDLGIKARAGDTVTFLSIINEEPKGALVFELKDNHGYLKSHAQVHHDSSMPMNKVTFTNMKPGNYNGEWSVEGHILGTTRVDVSP